MSKPSPPQPELTQFLNKGWKDVKVAYNRRDLITYAIGIGAQDLKFTYEGNSEFQMFPTYPFVLAFKGADQDVVQFPSEAMVAANTNPPIRGIRTGLDGQRSIEIINPLPAEGGEFILRNRLLSVSGKPKGAVVESESVVTDASGKEYVRMLQGTFLVGPKGVGSAGKPCFAKVPKPSREPDAVIEYTTLKNQAHIYRLSGDYNPLHIDPKFAKFGGFKEPILHGLCSLGFSTRAVVEKYGDIKGVSLRFASPVYPGETLVISMWKEGSKVLFSTSVKERNKVVIDNAYATLAAPTAKL
mmetsp:Transcript_27997/g.55106  ORF Transcript_27997/g.55106 Transcript_27997/m.55106 type:complete len:299 (+) Transcript_27997:2-898(+)